MARRSGIVLGVMLMAAEGAKAATRTKSGAVHLQIGGALELAGRATATFEDGEDADRRAGSTRLLRLLNPEAGGEDGGSQGALAYPVMPAVSLRIGYRFQNAEDRVGKVSALGAIEANYRSHKLLPGAAWHFPF